MTEAVHTPSSILLKRRPLEAKKFAKAYVKHGGNATKAASEVKALKYDSARQTGMRLLKREDVQREIAQALIDEGLSIGYVLNARKQFVDKGMNQLNGEKRPNEPFVSPKDVHSHLQGIEAIMLRLGEESGKSNPTVGLHLHLESKSVPDVLKKRQELSTWFNGILDGEIEPQAASDTTELEGE